MELTPYVESLRADLESAAAAGTDATRETARLLATALEPAVRLSLVDALSAMAAEVTAAAELGSVEIRMHGREPQVVVFAEPAGEAAPLDPPSATPPPPDADDDGATARVTLRLPESLKAQTEERAAAEGLSVNAWLVRAVHEAVHGGHGWPLHGWVHGPGAAWPDGRRGGGRGRRITGYGRA